MYPRSPPQIILVEKCMCGVEYVLSVMINGIINCHIL